jgi:putative redox protein
MTRIAHVTLDCAAGYATVAHAGHHTLLADEGTAAGGTDTGPSPTAMWLSSLGACTAITLRMYGDRKQWTLGTIHVDCTLVKDGEALSIERIIRCSEPLTDEQRARLGEIAEKTPVTKLVKAGTPIATTVAP